MSAPFINRFPWKLLNHLSPERQRRWIAKRTAPPTHEIGLPFRQENGVAKWIILDEQGSGWPACGNAVAHWGGETHLFAPHSLAGVVHPGCSLHHFHPEEMKIGGDKMAQFLEIAQKSPPQLILLLDSQPTLPLLYWIGNSGAPYRVGFGPREHSPFLNLTFSAKSPREWGALLTKWLEPN